MTESDFPSPGEVIPHSGPMLLVDSIVEHDSDRTICRVIPADHDIFLEPGDGAVPSWVGLEYMGQAACAHVVLRMREERGDNSDVPAGGILISARDVTLDFDGFHTDRTYLAEGKRVFSQERLQVCECSMRDADSGNVIMEGRLNAYVTQDFEDLEGAEP